MASVRVHRRDDHGKPVMWRVSYKNETGKWNLKYFDEEATAKLFSYDCLKSEIVTGTPQRKNGSFWGLWQKFMDTHVARFRKNTISNYERTAIVIKPFITTIHDFNTDTIVRALLSKKHKANTRNTYYAKLVRFSRWAKGSGHLFQIDWTAVKDATRVNEVQTKRFLTIEEYRSIYCWFIDHHMPSKALLIQLLAERGFRINEILLSTIDDIDPKTEAITIRAEIEKTKKGRTVHLGRFFIDSINQHRQQFNKSNSNAIFIDERTGEGLQYKNCKKWWYICTKELGVRNKPLHRLRALAYYLIYKTSGHNLTLAKQVCGWQSDAHKFYENSMGDHMPMLDSMIRRVGTGWTIQDGDSTRVGTTMKGMIEAQHCREKLLGIGIDGFWLDNFMMIGYTYDLSKVEKIADYLGYRLALVKKPRKKPASKRHR